MTAGTSPAPRYSSGTLQSQGAPSYLAAAHYTSPKSTLGTPFSSFLLHGCTFNMIFDVGTGTPLNFAIKDGDFMYSFLIVNDVR